MRKRRSIRAQSRGCFRALPVWRRDSGAFCPQAHTCPLPLPCTRAGVLSMDCRVRSTAADLHGKRGSQSAVWVLQDGSRPDETQLQRVYFADGEPVTLKFADRVGKILTAGLLEPTPRCRSSSIS